ncbi:hypothetical protein ES319_D02G252800v1 [Gossypium barbadense]|uniref:Arginine decarboxylase n=2 Tax=Gossypium TaxID=3633 RepID=A0A5J5SHD8_GOSBA|nr:hypothetical protein ES319_D02G252800v1 [Gossypium barbadense]TYG81110.1 hypothetical protein ES288_D02G271300v1 [Gossypium darwinii]
MPVMACCVDSAVAPPGHADAGDTSIPSPVPFLSFNAAAVTAAVANSESSHWSPAHSSAIYRIEEWGAPYFSVNSSGNVVVRPYGTGSLAHQEIDLLKIVKKVSDPKSAGGLGLRLPLIVRLPDVLKNRVESLHSAFESAIQAQCYESHYQGVYPVKCNQDRLVAEDIVKFGAPFRFGLEAGSKPELLLAMSCLCKGNPEALLVCNGFKDAEYVSLALIAKKLALNTVIVLEQEEEVNLVIDLSNKLSVRPVIGVRAKLRTKHSGHFGSTSGEKGKFGLTTTQILRLVKKLQDSGMLDCLQLLHFHIGSQIPSTALLQDGVVEATQIYSELVRLGACMKVIDIGGGLGIDYDGSKSAMRHENETCLLYADQLKQRCVEQFIEGSLRIEQLADVDGLFDLVSKVIGAAEPARIYNVNLSIFTSIPDFWSIGQVFPIVPIHRLDEKPEVRGVLSDLTCDSDGKIDKFIGGETSLLLHELEGNDGGANGRYYLGMFLGGAYQEALGGVHNLFGGPNVVSVLQSDGPQSFAVTRVMPGPSCADVLRMMQHEPELMFETLKHRAEEFHVEDHDNDGTKYATLISSLARSFHNMPYLKALSPCSYEEVHNAAAEFGASEDEQWSYCYA